MRRSAVGRQKARRQPGQASWSRLPAVYDVQPPGGTILGSVAIAITGSGFTGATGVTVGGSPATLVVVVTDGLITAVAPVGVAGSAAVAVVTPRGTSKQTGVFVYA